MIKKSGMDDPAYAKDSKHFDKYLTVQGWLKTRNNLYKIKKDKKEQLNYFDWKLDFPEIMNEQIAENVGFDIVIGNPPFIDSVKMTQIMPDYRNELKNRYRSANGNWDLYVVFVERGLSLLKNWGKFTFIIPNKILSVPYAITVREILSN
jgi:adenine-specific DNA-methyltransferase